ncbi:MAG: hypothetical protein ACRELF_01355 [Gemmataceae bacterium]
MSKAIGTLPLLSAAVLTALGLWLCYESLHPETSVTHSARP